MINIDFPTDPSSLIFIVTPKFHHFYLAARAAKHYGPTNIEVAGILPAIEPQSHDKHTRSMHAFAEALGLPTMRIVCNSAISEENKITNKGVSTLAKYIQQKTSGVMDYSTTPFDLSHGAFIYDMLLLAGIDGENPVAGVGKRIAHGHLKDHTLDAQLYPPDESAPDFIWTPLQNYTTAEILASAEKEGLLEAVLTANSCYHFRPFHCGICPGCVKRRHTLLQAAVTDTTFYECA